MKKYLIYISPLLFLFLIISCDQEYDAGATNAVQYAGEWFYQVLEEDGETIIEEMDYHIDPLLTYSTADNTPNQFWINDQGETIHLMAMVTVSGDQTGFSTTGYGVNLEEVGDPSTDPTGANQVLMDTIDYGLVQISNGKIMPNAARVWEDMQQAPADSIYMELIFSQGVFSYTSREVVRHDTTGTPVDTIYIFEPNDNFYEALAPQDTIIISGHRQTGWEVYL